MKDLKARVFAIVLGATTGLSVVRYDSSGAKIVLDGPIPWVHDKGLWIWPYAWLITKLEELRTQFEPGDIIVSGMWGADLAMIKGSDDQILPLLHYRSATDDDLDQMLTYLGKTREEMYLLSGGAAAAFYQPLGILAATVRHRSNVLLDHEARAIVPFSSAVYLLLAGKLGQDPFMRQSLGLQAETANQIYDGLQISRLGNLIGAGKIWETDTVIKQQVHGGEISIIPTSHDSVFARLIGLAESGFVIWSGSWLGTTAKVEKQIQPTAETFKAKINFEGLGKYRAAVTNTGLWGPNYKALFRRLGVESYDEAAALAIAEMDAPALTIDELSSQDVVEAADKIRPNGLALAAYIKGVANTITSELETVARTLGLPRPIEVGITGGWAENFAFKEAMAMNRIKIIVPRHAASATHAGLAADGLVRCNLASNIKEALDMLPELGAE